MASLDAIRLPCGHFRLADSATGYDVGFTPQTRTHLASFRLPMSSVRANLCRLPLLVLMGAMPALAVPPASDPALADTSGCTALINIVQESLRGELEVPCAEPNREACEAKNGQIRAMLEIVEQRRQRKADECETLAQVNRLLRTLPPKG